MPGINPTFYHCGTCGHTVDQAGTTHTNPKGTTYVADHAPRPVAANWPEVRK
jgi:hypothetical protein